MNETRVLKEKMTQRTGQTISPSQKIRDSESEACCFPEAWRKQDILTVRTSANTIRPADSKHLSSASRARGQREMLKSGVWAGDVTAASYLPGLKHPVAASVVVHLVPPAQTNQQPPADVLEGKTRTALAVYTWFIFRFVIFGFKGWDLRHEQRRHQHRTSPTETREKSNKENITVFPLVPNPD